MIPEDALQIVLNGLDCCGIPYMITGSFAGNLHGVPRVTQDADLIIDTTLVSLLNFCQGLGGEFYADPEAAKTMFYKSRMMNIVHLSTGFKIDLILCKLRPFSKEEFKRRKPFLFLGQRRCFATPEDTILSKLEWSKMGESERQFQDAVNIASIQKDAIDREYLAKWAKEIGVANLLQKLLKEVKQV